MHRLKCLVKHVEAKHCEMLCTAVPCASSDETQGAAVLYEVENHIAVITLNRAKNRNAMSPELLQGVLDAARRVNADDRVRCVVVTGRGKNFCGGADFSNGGSSMRGDGGEERPMHGGEKTLHMYEHFLSLLDVSVPVIGALQGHAIGGGMGLALVCDIRVCHASSQYGSNFVRLGIHPGMATTYLLPRLVGLPRAVELLFTGRLIDGKEAVQIGLATHVADTPEGVLQQAMELAKQIAANAPLAMRWTKRSVYRHLGGGWDPQSAAWDEAGLQTSTFQTEDFKEGTRALLEKRPPKFTGR